MELEETALTKSEKQKGCREDSKSKITNRSVAEGLFRLKKQFSIKKGGLAKFRDSAAAKGFTSDTSVFAQILHGIVKKQKVHPMTAKKRYKAVYDRFHRSFKDVERIFDSLFEPSDAKNEDNGNETAMEPIMNVEGCDDKSEISSNDAHEDATRAIIEYFQDEIWEVDDGAHPMVTIPEKVWAQYVLESSLQVATCQPVLKDEGSENNLDLNQNSAISAEVISWINELFSTGSDEDVFHPSLGQCITRGDIKTLSSFNWLNDEIMNSYMNLLVQRGENDQFPSVHAMNTFFYPKLASGGHESVERWTKKINIFSKDTIVVPIHLGMHWCMSIIDFRNQSIKYYDSLGHPNPECLLRLINYVRDESIVRTGKKYCFLGWNLECVRDIPRQTNTSDCGVFSCTFAEYVCAGKNFNFDQEHMPYFRYKMAFEILTGKVLD